MKSPIPNRKRSRGFTLVELMVVVTIIGVILGAGLVYLGATRDVRSINQAVQSTSLQLQQLRVRAMSNGQPVLVDIGASALGEGSGDAQIAWFDSTNGSCIDPNRVAVGTVTLLPNDGSARYRDSVITDVQPSATGDLTLCFTTAGRVVDASTARPFAAVGNSEFGGRVFIEMTPTRCAGDDNCTALPIRRTLAVEFNGLTQSLGAEFDVDTL